jgi:hypothetical protein
VRFARYHSKIWLLWGKGWAVQLYRNRYLSLGVHVDWGRPYMDLHIGWLIVSLGDNPVITNAEDEHRHSCRGLLFRGDPLL